MLVVAKGLFFVNAKLLLHLFKRLCINDYRDKTLWQLNVFFFRTENCGFSPFLVIPERCCLSCVYAVGKDLMHARMAPIRFWHDQYSLAVYVLIAGLVAAWCWDTHSGKGAGNVSDACSLFSKVKDVLYNFHFSPCYIVL